MTNKELFIETVKRARREEIATNGLERALGYVEIKNDDLTACFAIKFVAFFFSAGKTFLIIFMMFSGLLYATVLRLTYQMALTA